nr:acyltransferase family protein [Paludibacter sp.]
MEIKSRFEWADNLRFFATISVIILHVASTALYFFNKIPLSHWLIADLTDSAMRFCVPLFLMISGGLLLRENHKPIEFFKKR